MTSIDSDRIGLFLKTTYSTDKLSKDDAKDLGVKLDDFKEADTDKDGVLTLDEIEDCDDVKEFLTSIIQAEDEIKNEKDEEAEKEEQDSVSGTGNSGKS